MNGLSLCAGVGGLELGLHLALGDDYRTVCYVEREAHAAAILVARMEEGIMAPAPVWDDLLTFDGSPWRGVVDLVSAGYPCQPFSFAGRRDGSDDPRHLWPQVARVVREVEPAVVFLENVPGHLSLGFDVVVQDLQGMDYRVAACISSAAEVGAPHRRERLFILAHRDAVGDTDLAGSQGRSEPERGGRNELPAWPPSPSGDWSRIPERLWPATEIEPGVRRVADGMAARVDRLRACGNGVVPLVAAHAFRTLAAELNP